MMSLMYLHFTKFTIQSTTVGLHSAEEESCEYKFGKLMDAKLSDWLSLIYYF